MRARARLVIAGVGAGSYAADVHCEVPFAIRRAAGRFLVVASAAAPVGGDDLEIDISVGAGATADVGTAAATLVWPGTVPSRQVARLTVADGGHLDWRPEPTVSVAGSDHVAHTVVELTAGATCRIVEEFALGRAGEPSGRLATRLRVVRDGVALIDHGEMFGPTIAGAGSVARVGPARHVFAEVVVGPRPPAPQAWVDVAGVSIARLPLADAAALVLAAGPDRPSVLTALAVNRSARQPGG